jgi:hypothetical protein
MASDLEVCAQPHKWDDLPRSQREWAGEGCRLAAIAYLERECALAPTQATRPIESWGPRFMWELAKVLSPEPQSPLSLLELITL